MDFIEVETNNGRLLVSVYEIMFISESENTTQIQLKGIPITLIVSTPLDDIIEQLNSGYNDEGGILFKAN